MSQPTTVTLEDDVAERLRNEARRSGKSMRAVVNGALRHGLDARPEKRGPYRVPERPTGLRAGLSLDDVEGLLDAVEGPDRR